MHIFTVYILYIYIYIRASVFTTMYVYNICTCLISHCYVHIHTHTHIYIYIMFIVVCIYIFIYIYISLSLLIYTFIFTYTYYGWVYLPTCRNKQLNATYPRLHHREHPGFFLSFSSDLLSSKWLFISYIAGTQWDPNQTRSSERKPRSQLHAYSNGNMRFWFDLGYIPPQLWFFIMYIFPSETFFQEW